MPLAPFVMMKTLSKMRNASSARNSTATMIAAFMLGRMTLVSTCQFVAPSTLAASSMSPGTWARPERSRSEMNGVVFHTSDRMMTVSEVPVEANQLRFGSIPGIHESQLFM